MAIPFPIFVIKFCGMEIEMVEFGNAQYYENKKIATLTPICWTTDDQVDVNRRRTQNDAIFPRYVSAENEWIWLSLSTGDVAGKHKFLEAFVNYYAQWEGMGTKNHFADLHNVLLSRGQLQCCEPNCFPDQHTVCLK